MHVVAVFYNTVEPLVGTTSPWGPVFYNTVSFLVRSLYLEPLCKRPPLIGDRDHI